MNYAQLLFPDFSLILLGYLLCRYTQLNRPLWEKVESLVYYLLFPVLLFHSIVKTPLDLQVTSKLMAAGWTMGLVGIALAYSLPHLPMLRSRMSSRDHAASAQVAFRFNSFIGLAIAERLAGPPGLQLIAVLIGVCVPLFNVAAVWPMARQGQGSFASELIRNPLIVGTVAGLLSNLAGFQMPAWLEPTIARLGAASLAMGLMAAGAGMQISALMRTKALAASVLSIRHFFLPLVAWLIARLFGLDTLQSTILLAFSALPTASTCYLLAARMGYDGAYVAGLVTMSTVLGVVSLPFALGILRSL